MLKTTDTHRSFTAPVRRSFITSLRFSLITPLRSFALSVALGASSLVATAQTPAGETPLVLTNVTVIDGSGARPKTGMTIVISGGRITGLHPAGKKPLPAGASVMDLRGHYVMPGLIDSHYHFMPGKWPGAEGAARRRFAFLGGVTTARDMAGDAVALAELAAEAARPDVQSPRVYYSALMAGQRWFGDRRAAEISHGRPAGEAPWARAVNDTTDIPKLVSEAKATGAVALKLYEHLTAEQISKLTAEARRQGLKVWSHSAVFPGGPADAVAAGVNSLSHSDGLIYAGLDPEQMVWDSYRKLDWGRVAPGSPAVVRLLRRMRRKGIFLDATLHLYGEMAAEELAKEESKRNKWELARTEWAYEVTRLAHRHGVPVVAGTDLPERPRRRDVANIHLELELLVNKAGLTPLEAITAATRNGARLLGIEDSYGTIARGKVADLVVLSADPAADIRNTRKVVYVLKGGRPHRAEKVVMPD